MITWFTIGLVVFAVKLACIAFKAAWGVTRGILFVLGIPAGLIAMLVAGLMSIAVPLLGFGLLAAFLLPVLTARRGR